MPTRGAARPFTVGELKLSKSPPVSKVTGRGVERCSVGGTPRGIDGERLMSGEVEVTPLTFSVALMWLGG